MNMNAFGRALWLAAACCGVGTARADVFTSGCTLQVNQACSLAELLSNPDAYVTIDGVRFVNFTAGNVPFDIASRISVAAIDGPGGEGQPGNVVGLEFSPFDGLPGLLQDFGAHNFERSLSITYDIEVDAGLPVAASSTSLRFGEAVFNPGDDIVWGGWSKTIRRPGLDDTFMLASCRMPSPAAPSCAQTRAAADAVFGPARRLSIVDTLFIVHFTTPVPTDRMPAFSQSGIQILDGRQTFFRVPEPGAPSLLTIGAAAMVLGGRRRRREVEKGRQ